MYFAVMCLVIPIVANITYKYVSFNGQPAGYTIYVTGLGAVAVIVLMRTSSPVSPTHAYARRMRSLTAWRPFHPPRTLPLHIGYMSMAQAMAAVRPSVLLTIASSFSMGQALHISHLDTEIANFLLPIFEEWNHFGVILGLFVMTAFMSSWVSNAAAVNIMFPIGVSFYQKGGLSPRSLAYTYVALVLVNTTTINSSTYAHYHLLLHTA